MHQPLGVIYSIRIARHFTADHSVGVGMSLPATNPANGLGIQHFHLKGTGARTVMRAGGMCPPNRFNCHGSKRIISFWGKASPNLGQSQRLKSWKKRFAAKRNRFSAGSRTSVFQPVKDATNC